MKTFNSFEIEEFNVKSFDDRRKKVNRLIVSYKDIDGYEYRKRFEFPTSMNFEEMKKEIPNQIN